MPYPLAVFAADCHLSNTIWVDRPEIHGDAIHSFRQIVDWILKNHRPGLRLFLPGDLFDKNVQDDAFVLRQFVSELGRMTDEKEVQVLHIQGQHEMTRRVPWASLADNAEHFHKKKERLYSTDLGREIVLYGLDFQAADRLDDALKAIPEDVEILVCHQVWKELMGNIGNPEGSFAQIPEHVKTVVTGDYHQHFQKEICGKLVVSTGSSHIRSLKEEPQKSFFVLMSDGAFQSVPLQTRPVVFDRLVTPTQLAEVKTRTFPPPPNMDLRPIWRVEYVHDLPEAREILRKIAKAADVHLFDKPVGMPKSEAAVDAESATLDVYAALDAETADDEDLRKACRKLLDCPEKDLAAAVYDIVDEAMAADWTDNLTTT